MTREEEAEFKRLTPAMKLLIHFAYVHENYRHSVYNVYNYGRDVEAARMLEHGGFVQTWDINHGMVMERSELGKEAAKELGGRRPSEYRTPTTH